MHWTNKKPDRPGWWWYSDHAEYGEKELVEIAYPVNHRDSCYDELKLYARCTTGGYSNISTWRGMWSSEPVPEPAPLGSEE